MFRHSPAACRPFPAPRRGLLALREDEWVAPVAAVQLLAESLAAGSAQPRPQGSGAPSEVPPSPRHCCCCRRTCTHRMPSPPANQRGREEAWRFALALATRIGGGLLHRQFPGPYAKSFEHCFASWRARVHSIDRRVLNRVSLRPASPWSRGSCGPCLALSRTNRKRIHGKPTPKRARSCPLW